MPIRIAILRWTSALAAATVAITEVLSLFQSLNRASIAIVWLITLAALTFLRPLRVPLRPSRLSWFPAAVALGITCIAVLIGWTAAVSPPNSADAMSYHLPRVLHWMQNGSVRFFPTSYLPLLMMPPAAEYMMLHAYLLSGGDGMSNFFQFAAYLGSVIGVSCLAGLMGLDPKAQAIAALFCATLPNAILQASGAKNDVVLACFLVCAAVFAARWRQTHDRADLVFLALTTGLAFLTKGTAYLFAPPLLMTIIPVRDWPKTGAAIAAGILLVNGPQFARNIDLSGSPLGFDSAHADGVFRWRVEHFGWKPTVSNLLRNTSEQLGGRSETWNARVYETVNQIHRALGISPQDPGATWPWTEFRPPVNANHEANANNRWHLLIFVLALPFCRGRWIAYAAGLIGAFLLCCFYLKWQPYFSRMELPLFTLMSPVAAMAISRIPHVTLQALICAVLLSNTRLAVTANWTRPLTGPNSILRISRNQAYFNDTVQWNNHDPYIQAVDATVATGCLLVGVDTTQNHVHYPYEVLVRQRNPKVRFVETGVKNVSLKYAHPELPKPCVVFCPDCNGLAEKVTEYQTSYNESRRSADFFYSLGEIAN